MAARLTGALANAVTAPMRRAGTPTEAMAAIVGFDGDVGCAGVLDEKPDFTVQPSFLSTRCRPMP